VGGDFTVRFIGPEDDTYFSKACALISSGQIDASQIRTHVWEGLESVKTGLDEQAAGKVIKGFVLIAGR
jgi:hypothetical protein